jgi:hypothetical protein
MPHSMHNLSFAECDSFGGRLFFVYFEVFLLEIFRNLTDMGVSQVIIVQQERIVLTEGTYAM